MKTYYFSVSMPFSECEALYTGFIKYVLMKADSGENVQVPAVNIRPMITRQGIKGRFRMLTDDKHKILAFERIA